MKDHNLLIILGATASGKTKLAVQLANTLNGEVISADSRQVFKRMDIGTGKDLQEYSLSNKTIPYHLIDILEPGEKYNVNAFKNDFYKAFESITIKEKLPILCGGTGMYIHSLLQNQTYTSIPNHLELRNKLEFLSKEELIMNLELYKLQNIVHADVSSKKRLIRAIEIAAYLEHHELKVMVRPTLKPVVFGLKNEVEATRSKILKRLDIRLNSGMIEEVERLLAEGVSSDMLVFYGLEYKFISNYLLGLIDFDDLKLKLGIAICQYAKRQNTFFRKMEKDGVLINWLDAARDIDFLEQRIIEIMSTVMI